MAEGRLRLQRFLPYRLSVLANRVSAAIAASYSDRFGLSIAEWRVIAVVAETPGLSAVEVAARTAMDKVAVSRAVASLLRARRLRRRTSPGDRRRSVLSLTPAGEAIYQEIVPLALGHQQALLDALSAGDRADLDRILDRLLEHTAAEPGTP